MVDDADLELNVLEFASKSFSFERSVELDGQELALFHRTETESESRFRPKVIRLRLIVPKTWIIYDLAADLLRLGQGRRDARAARRQLRGRGRGRALALRRGRDRLAAGPGRGGNITAPEEWADRLLSPDGLRLVGLG